MTAVNRISSHRMHLVSSYFTSTNAFAFISNPELLSVVIISTNAFVLFYLHECVWSNWFSKTCVHKTSTTSCVKTYTRTAMKQIYMVHNHRSICDIVVYSSDRSYCKQEIPARFNTHGTPSHTKTNFNNY